MRLTKFRQILVLPPLMSALSSFNWISCKFNPLLCKRWFSFRTALLLFSYVNVNGPLFSANSILRSIVCNYLYVTVFLRNVFFKKLLTHLIIITYTTPHQGMAGHIKFYIIFLKQINCCVSSNIKLVPLLLNKDDSVPLHLKNLDRPLIQAGELYDDTKSKHIHVSTKFASKITMLCKFYYLRVCY